MSTRKGTDMAIIDYSDVTSLRYAQLSLPAKALIPVLATLADKKTGLLPDRHSKLHTLATYAGISYNATRAALQVLHDTQCISLDIAQGHPPRIIYLPVAQFSTRAGSPPPAELATHHEESQHQLNFTPNPLPVPENPQRQHPCLTVSLNSLKTTTEPDIPKLVIKEMISRHGASVVVEVISGMKKKAAAGEEIKNPSAYFRKCCENNWVPTSANIQEREKRAQAAASLKERKRTDDDALKAHHRSVRQDQRNPETQKRIREAQAKFWSTVNTREGEQNSVNFRSTPGQQDPGLQHPPG